MTRTADHTDVRRLVHLRVIAVVAALGVLGCLEPNPNADAGESSTTGSNTSASTTDTTTADPPVPVDFAFEELAFEAGPNDFMGTLAKPDQPHVVPIAIIEGYDPRNAEAMGYAVSWTDNGSSYEFSLALDGADNNSRVRGRAIALGFAEPPQTHTIEVDAATGCASAVVQGASGLAIVDAIEAYSPAGGVVHSYARTANDAGDSVTIEVCVTNPDVPEASVRVSVIAFAPPDGVETFAADDTVVDSQVPASISFANAPAGAQVLHLVSARGFDDASATNLGYAIDCNAGAAPYACGLDLMSFKPGASVTAGGLLVAIP